MVKFVKVMQTNELKEGQMRSVAIQGQEILLARVNGRFYAANNICPHMGGNLSQGILRGTVVTCPRHHSQFDL